MSEQFGSFDWLQKLLTRTETKNGAIGRCQGCGAYFPDPARSLVIHSPPDGGDMYECGPIDNVRGYVWYNKHTRHFYVRSGDHDISLGRVTGDGDYSEAQAVFDLATLADPLAQCALALIALTRAGPHICVSRAFAGPEMCPACNAEEQAHTAVTNLIAQGEA